MTGAAAHEVRRVPVSEPVLGELEYASVDRVMREGAISGFAGSAIAEFEAGFASFSDSTHGVATSSGTTALHLALAALGITTGDEVLVATLTNMATFFSVIYQGAFPIPIDVEESTGNLDPALLEARVTPRTRAILVVHLFGHPVDMDPVMAVAARHGLKVIEDCAEAHGATYRGRKVGSIGDVGCFSFYGNKIITTGEGGMLTTADAEVAARARSLRSLAFGDSNKFMHKAVGYNYRMSNVQAAIGVAQLTRIEAIIERKRAIARRYSERLKSVPGIQLPVEKEYARNVYWMYHVVLRGALASHRTEVMASLAERGIETRESFIPFNLQEIFIAEGRALPEECPIANEIGRSGFYLPSGPTLSDDDVDFVADALAACASRYGA